MNSLYVGVLTFVVVVLGGVVTGVVRDVKLAPHRTAPFELPEEVPPCSQEFRSKSAYINSDIEGRGDFIIVCMRTNSGELKWHRTVMGVVE